MTQRERMMRGLPYLADDPELRKMRETVQKRLQQYNQLLPSDSAQRYRLISKIFGQVGDECSVYPPFFCDYGVNIRVGHRFFANFGCTILDTAPISIGNNVFLGPGVKIIAASHPIDPGLRADGFGIGHSIAICNNAWIGAGAIINPGITVGENSVIGSGSVVTHDVPERVVAAGNPCRVIRQITERDILCGGDNL